MLQASGSGRGGGTSFPTIRGRTWVIEVWGSLLFSIFMSVPQAGHMTFFSRCSAYTRRYSPQPQRMSWAPVGALRRRVVRPSEWAGMMAVPVSVFVGADPRRRILVSSVWGSLYCSIVIDTPQTGHFTFFPAMSLRATRGWPQEQTSLCEPAGMRMASPLAGSRVRTFSRDLGSTAQTTLKTRLQEGQVWSWPAAPAGIETWTPQAQRTDPSGAPGSFPTSA